MYADNGSPRVGRGCMAQVGPRSNCEFPLQWTRAPAAHICVPDETVRRAVDGVSAQPAHFARRRSGRQPQHILLRGRLSLSRVTRDSFVFVRWPCNVLNVITPP